MKKILTVLFASCVLMSIFGCDIDSTAPKKETNTETQSDTVSENNEEVFAMNESAVFDNLKITATELKESKGKEFFYAEDGKIFVGVNFEIENISEDTQNVSSLLLFDAYVDDVKCDYSFNASVAFDEGTLDGELSPGKKLAGWYSVEVPNDWIQLELEVKSNWLSNNKAKFVFNK